MMWLSNQSTGYLWGVGQFNPASEGFDEGKSSEGLRGGLDFSPSVLFSVSECSLLAGIHDNAA